MLFCIVMKDECGCECRAFEEEFFFPTFDEDDDAMTAALFAWQDSILEKSIALLNEKYPDHSSVWMEETYESIHARVGFNYDLW